METKFVKFERPDNEMTLPKFVNKWHTGSFFSSNGKGFTVEHETTVDGRTAMGFAEPYIMVVMYDGREDVFVILADRVFNKDASYCLPEVPPRDIKVVSKDEVVSTVIEMIGDVDDDLRLDIEHHAARL